MLIKHTNKLLNQRKKIFKKIVNFEFYTRIIKKEGNNI